VADDMTTTKDPATGSKKDADPNDAVNAAIANLRAALIDSGMDPGLADAKLHAAKPNETNIVGNFADLQRLGGALVGETGGIADAFVAPPEPASAAAEASAGVVE
jgi:hypothetical protein